MLGAITQSQPQAVVEPKEANHTYPGLPVRVMLVDAACVEARVNRTTGLGVRCPELGPSDLWGLFPVGCTALECASASAWAGTGSADVVFEGARLLNEGRGGLRAPNYRHVNATYHSALTYAQQQGDPAQLAQPECFTVQQLSPSDADEDAVADFSAETLLQRLFPAAQLTSDSPLVAVCTRFLIEEARATALADLPGGPAAALQAAAWRRRCEAKVRDASACDFGGLFVQAPPPAAWRTLSAGCGVQLQLPARAGDAAYLQPMGGGEAAFLTPGCVLVDRVSGQMYDARLCVHTAGREATQSLTDWSHITARCALVPQPLALLQGDVPYSMAYTDGGQPLSAEWLSNLSPAFTLETAEAAVRANAAPGRDHVSQVFDWWPSSSDVRSPPGFHITAPTDPAELAPLLFDSHYVYDPDTFTAFYVHSAARNGSLLFDTLGAAGVCRAPNVAMPLVDANTNRICTRMSLQAASDTPHMPIDARKTGGGPEEAAWPFSQAYVERYFAPEACAADHTDVPWTPRADEDPQSLSAGGIPGWQALVSMDTQGATIYPFGYFPPSADTSSTYRATELGDVAAAAWGPCAGTVRWGAGVPCDPSSSAGCPGQQTTQCLAIVDNRTMDLTLVQNNNKQQTTTKGLCASTATFLQAAAAGDQPTRAPCFQTSQCPDGSVCLADGACAPLRFHVWNRAAHDYDMEVGVVADACGFQEPMHPFTQTTRGASPWEVLPDLFHAHGFCSHRDWFAYRNALWTLGDTCPLRADAALRTGPSFIGYHGTISGGGGDAYLACNASAARWPWVHERFDMQRATVVPGQTMAEGHTLMAVPHVCDQAFMHLQAPASGERLQLCSGFQGRQDWPAQLYPLAGADEDWAAVALPSSLSSDSAAGAGASSNLSFWMRTYDETTGELHVGVIDNDIRSDVPLGFLGASLGADDGVLNDMASDMLGKVNFFRCADRLACSDPAFTYNGVAVRARLDPISLQGNFSEASLRLCGAIGHTASEWPNALGGGGACWLDIALFPLLMQMLWGGDATSMSSCATLWAPVAALGPDTLVVVNGNAEAVSLATLQSAPRTLFCEAAPWGRCVYAARASTRLSADSQQDAIVYLAGVLNGLLRAAGRAVRAALPVLGATRTYEHINRCAAQLMLTLSTAQAAMQPVYGTAGPSGVYVALRVTLYEVPVAWLHHAMLVTLLAALDPSVPAPPLDTLGLGGVAIPVFLWTHEDRAPICSDPAELDRRVVLWRLICRNAHPAYTFAVSDPFAGDPLLLADRAADALRTQAAQDIQTNLPSNAGGVEAFCYGSARWACDRPGLSGSDIVQCLAARALAYNQTASSSTAGLTACQAAVVYGDASGGWLDPCRHPERFAYPDPPQAVSLDALNLLDGGPTGGLVAYLAVLTQAALAAADRVAVPVDYIGELWGDEETGGGLPVLRVWPMAELLLANGAVQGFDMGAWLRTDVCRTTTLGAGLGGVCSDQYATDPAQDACLYPWAAPPADAERYLQPPTVQAQGTSTTADPVIVLHYAGGRRELINVCDLPADGADACIAQYGGSPTQYLGAQGLIPCDIVGVEAPPGVQIQAYALRMPLGGASNRHDWLTLLGPTQCGGGLACPMSLCTASDAPAAPSDGSPLLLPAEVRSCTWTEGADGAGPYASAWWFNGTTMRAGRRPDLDAFGPLRVSDFGSMGQWWPTYASQWQNLGCATDPGVCSLRIRREPKASGTGAAFCGRNVPDYSFNEATRLRAPNCDLEMGREGFDAFTIARGANAALYRCGPCTRASNTLRVPSGALMNCFLAPVGGTNTTAPQQRAEDLLTQLTMPQTTAYLQDAGALVAAVTGLLPYGSTSTDDVWSAVRREWPNGTALDVVVTTSGGNNNPAVTQSLERWGQLATVAGVSRTGAACDASSPASCGFSGYDINFAQTDDASIWNKAVANPGVQFTMVCQAQKYTGDDAQRCNPAVDGRRQALAGFVDARYRRANGAWLQTVPPGMGGAWVANAASARTGLFSLLHASSARAEADVLTAWVLGEGPCGSEPTVIQNRVCVESTVRDGTGFQALHPWLGGDFNPFEKLDECPSATTGTGLASLCPCPCEPSRSCEDPTGAHNYSAAFMAAEFPPLAACMNQAFPRFRVMDATDASNLCAQTRAAANGRAGGTTCRHAQGLLGGALDGARAVTADELHGEGVPTHASDLLVQELMGGQDAWALSSGNGLWMGRTLQQERVLGTEKYAFLSMPRFRLHPAHVAFATDPMLTGEPLVVERVALLPYLDGYLPPSGVIDPAWPGTLEAQYAVDRALIARLYPQLQPQQQQASAGGDWSCPFRAAAFWGAARPAFAPLVPHPVLAHALYGLQGPHPLIKAAGLADRLQAYRTTNGACFYRADITPAPQLSIADAASPCGLQGMLRALHAQTFLPSAVVGPFDGRCGWVLDAPDIGGALRSGETLPSQKARGQRCGVLDRLSPFLMRTRGDGAAVRVRPDGTTVRDDGGDCHMGRALTYPLAQRGRIAGRACALVSKNATHGVSACTSSSASSDPPFPRRLVFARATPLGLDALVALRTPRYYRDDIGVRRPATPAFVGPGNTKLQEPETSFGLLYATSLRRALAHDLVVQGAGCGLATPWPGATFWRSYLGGAWAGGSNNNCTSSSSSYNTPPLPNRSLAASLAQRADARLWNATTTGSHNNNNNNIWSTSTSQPLPGGYLDRTLWVGKKARYAACNQSYRSATGLNSQQQLAVRAISLCEPAPTAGLQALCRAMLQYRTDIGTVNCEIMGNGTCLYRPGAFYVPYMWSATNQQFSADTVRAYYQNVVAQPRFANESFGTLCPAGSDLLSQIAALSQTQAQQCPGHQIEFLKGVLETLKLVGHKLLYMGYCVAMFAANAIGALFAQSGFIMDAMLRLAGTYLLEFIRAAESIIMPILNAIVNVLFGTSSVGRIIKTALGLLCRTYNFAVEYFFVPIWCGVLRPALYGIFMALHGVFSVFWPDAADKTQKIAMAIAGGDSGMDVRSCMGSLTLQIQCDADTQDTNTTNAAFLAAPIATRCWTDTSPSMQLAGAGPFGGGGDASFLACTASDTCAQDPFHFDDSTGASTPLIACGACPTVNDASMQADTGSARQFGCDTVLKRCTCGVAAQAAIPCLSSNDCAQQGGAICAVVSNLDHVADAASHMPCAQCGGMGMQPACVRSTLFGSTGVCACAAVAQAGTLQTCATPGQHLPLLSAIGFCLASADPDLAASGGGAPALVLDFSSLSIAPCLAGISDNACVTVRLPLSTGGQYPRSLVVIFLRTLQQTASGGARRRLLGAAVVDTPTNNNNTAMLLQSDELTLLRALLAQWASQPNNHNHNANHHHDADEEEGCRRAWAHGDRERVKECLFWQAAGVTAMERFNLSSDLLLLPLMHSSGRRVSSLYYSPPTAWELVVQKPEAARFLLRQHSGLWPVLLDAGLQAGADTWHILHRVSERMSRTDEAFTSRRMDAMCEKDREDVLGLESGHSPWSAYVSKCPQKMGDTRQANRRGRALLQTASTPALSSGSSSSSSLSAWDFVTCPVLQEPANHIQAAFRDTIYFYTSGSADTSYLDANASTVLDLPPSGVAAAAEGGGLAGRFLDTLFMGYGTPILRALVIRDDELPPPPPAITTTAGGTTTTTTKYLTGRTLLRELSACNYTALTLGTNSRVRAGSASLLYLIALVVLAFTVLSAVCAPTACMRLALWMVLFPMVLLWVAYGVSPLCWPMIPPRLPHDVATELQALVPESFEIPRFLVQPDCTVRGMLLDGTFDPNYCYKQCTADPFLMRSWQDPLAWWACDLSPAFCVSLGDGLAPLGVFQDFVSSTVYYSQVVQFEASDPDFTGAHRLCAFFASYNVVFAFAGVGFALLVAPSVFVAVSEIFAGALVLLVQAAGAEGADTE